MFRKDYNSRQNLWKMTSSEENYQELKTTSASIDNQLHGKLKTTMMEESLKENSFVQRCNFLEDDPNGKQLQWKTILFEIGPIKQYISRIYTQKILC
jgi:hypothetical protein